MSSGAALVLDAANRRLAITRVALQGPCHGVAPEVHVPAVGEFFAG
jgi:hypothetical protein